MKFRLYENVNKWKIEIHEEMAMWEENEISNEIWPQYKNINVASMIINENEMINGVSWNGGNEMKLSIMQTSINRK